MTWFLVKITLLCSTPFILHFDFCLITSHSINVFCCTFYGINQINLVSVVYSHQEPIHNLTRSNGTYTITTSIISVLCKHHGEAYDILFHAVDKITHPLLGVSDRLILQLITVSNDVFEISVNEISHNVPEHILSKHPTLFDDKLGTVLVKYNSEPKCHTSY